jgi:hypothetical protein
VIQLAASRLGDHGRFLRRTSFRGAILVTLSRSRDCTDQPSITRPVHDLLFLLGHYNSNTGDWNTVAGTLYGNIA